MQSTVKSSALFSFCQHPLLSESKNPPQASPQLRSHSSPRVLRPHPTLLVLRSPPNQEIQALRHRAPRQQLDHLGILIGLHCRVLHQALADLVRHTLQLRVRQPRQIAWVGDQHLARADRLGSLDGLQVVCGEDDVDAWEGGGGV